MCLHTSALSRSEERGCLLRSMLSLSLWIRACVREKPARRKAHASHRAEESPSGPAASSAPALLQARGGARASLTHPLAVGPVPVPSATHPASLLSVDWRARVHRPPRGARSPASRIGSLGALDLAHPARCSACPDTASSR